MATFAGGCGSWSSWGCPAACACKGRAEHHLLHSAADALTLFALPLFFCQRSPSQDWSSLIGVDRDVSANSLIVAGASDILGASFHSEWDSWQLDLPADQVFKILLLVAIVQLFNCYKNGNCNRCRISIFPKPKSLVTTWSHLPGAQLVNLLVADDEELKS